MSDTPTLTPSTTTPVPIIQSPITAAQATEQYLHTQIASLASKHATVSYLLIAVLVAVLGLAGLGGYIGIKFADAQEARAEQQEQRYDADRQALQAQLSASEAARAQDAAQQQTLIAQISSRDSQAGKAIAAALKPDASLVDVGNGVTVAYSDVPAFKVPLPLNGVYVEFSAQQSQEVTAIKIDHDKLKLDLNDETNLYSLEKKNYDSSQTDLTSCKSTLSDANKTIASWKSAAKVSKFKKFLGGAEKASLFVAGLYLGHKL